MSLPRNNFTDANAVIHKLKHELRIHKKRNATLDEVEVTMRDVFSAALKAVPKYYSNLGLYLQLEKDSEPAALQKHLGSDIFSYLEEIKGVNSFKKILATFNIKPSRLKEFIRNPSIFLRHILFIKIQAAVIKAILSLPEQERRGGNQHTQADQELFDREATSLPAGFSHMHRLSKNLRRYPGPLAIFFEITNFLVAVPLYGILLTTIAVKQVCSYILKDVILDWITMDLMTGDFYGNALDNYAEQNYEAVKKYYGDYERIRDDRFLSLSEDELLFELNKISERTMNTEGKREAEDSLTNQINDDLRPRGFEYIIMVARAIYAKLFDDVPAESVSENLKKYIAWPLRFLAALPVIILAILFESTSRLADGVILAGAVTGTAITGATLLTSNLPLIIWDAPRYISDSAKNLFSRNDNTETLVNADTDEENQTLLVNDNGSRSPRSSSSYHLLLGDNGLLATEGDEEKPDVNPVITSPLPVVPLSTAIPPRPEERLDYSASSTLGLKG